MEVLPKLEAGRMSKYRCVSERVTPFDCSQHIQTPWIFTFKVGRINPTYQTISESDRCGSVGSAAVDPSISDRMYDVVGKEKAGKEVSNLDPPPLPPSTSYPSSGGTRHTTSNTLYVSHGDTLTHPVATLEKSTFSGPVESEIEDSMGDTDSFKCFRVVCLSLLVMVSLLMACVAVVLVLLLWFGVFVPDNACPTTTTTAPPCTCTCPGILPYHLCIIIHPPLLSLSLTFFLSHFVSVSLLSLSLSLSFLPPYLAHSVLSLSFLSPPLSPFFLASFLFFLSPLTPLYPPILL